MWGMIQSLQRLSFAALLGLPLVGMSAGSQAADAPAACPPAVLPVPELDHSRAAVTANKELLIVALGSSSTEGWMASSIGHSYPADLQADLTAELPKSHVAVINRGIGGQDAVEEVARLQADVLAVHPQLVIWQVGANGAAQGVDPEVFRQRVTAGVHQLQLAGVDVILMDNQRSPVLLAKPNPDALNDVLGEVAKDLDVGLFPRAHLFDIWRDEGFPYAHFISPDGMHQNDLGYTCVSDALAHVIAVSLTQKRRLATTAAVAPAAPATEK